MTILETGQMFHAECAAAMEQAEWGKYVEAAKRYTEHANRRRAARWN